MFQTTKPGNTETTETTEKYPARDSKLLIEAANMAKELFPVVPVVSVFQSFVVLAHQRSFSVDRPKRTSIIVMIQNRTTTWFSFQPFNS